LALAACGKDEPNPGPPPPPPPPPPVPGVVALTGEVKEAPKFAWIDLDRIGFYMTELGSEIISGKAENVPLKPTPGEGVQVLTPTEGKDIPYPTDERLKVQFYAYFPHDISVNDWSYSVNVKEQGSQRALDFMWAKMMDNNGKGYDKTQKSRVPVKLERQMAKWQLTVKRGEGVSSLSKLTVEIPSEPTMVSFDLRTGKGMELPTNMVTIFPLTVQQPKDEGNVPGIYVATLIPRNINDANDIVLLHLEEATYEIPLSKGSNKLEKGKVYEQEVELKRSGVVITSSSIKSWSDFNGTLGGDAY
jgi:hypothetical protein